MKLLLACVLFITLAGAQQQQAKSAAEPQFTWYNLAKMVIEGKGWSETKHLYDRLPATAENVVRAPVWSLSHDSAGLRYRFVTDAPALRARWTLRRNRLAMSHMAATGVSGIDLYVRDGNQWRWLAVGRPEHQHNEVALVSGLKPSRREFMLYLPLYNGIESIEIGVPHNTKLEQAPDRYGSLKPAVFYGTSILQGGCASRPGMAYPSIIGRMLDIPTINLGFSGNGKTEPEMAALLAELDPSVYVFDSLPNLDVHEARERVEPFITTLRKAHPETPIVLVENVVYTNARFIESRQEKVTGANEVLRSVYEKLKSGGDEQVYYVPASGLYGDDGEATVDGSHATDLGFLRMAGTIAPVVREALRK